MFNKYIFNISNIIYMNKLYDKYLKYKRGLIKN